MREILFRGKRVDNGEWVEGSLVIGNNYNFIITAEDYQDVVATQSALVCESHPIEKDNTTIGQYTGLTDKNGKKIFEGDIVKVCLPYADLTCIVGWEGCSFIIRDIKDSDYTYVLGEGFDIEVIGNIYDNPELLEV